jgi:hypothetical protein
MRRLYRLLLRLYPARFRAEFADEMIEVFDQACATERDKGATAFLRFCVRETGGLVVNLLAEERSMKHKRLVLSGALAGLLIGGIMGAAWAGQPYTSRAVLRVRGTTVPERLVPAQAYVEMRQMLPSISMTVLARGNLANILNAYNLYPAEQATMPLEDIIARMREATRIATLDDSSFEVSFTYPDRALAQKVTTDLVGRIIGEFVRARRTLAVLTVQFLKDSADAAGAAWEDSLAKVRAARSGGKPPDRLQLDADIARQRYEGLRAKLAEAEMLEILEKRQQGQTLELLDPPSLPPDSRPSLVIVALLGALGGAVAGLLTSIAFSYLSRPALADAA